MKRYKDSLDYFSKHPSAVGSKIDIESARDVAEPGPEFTHYYAAEPV